MNNRWRQIFKDFKKWNTEIQKAHGNKHRCLSKTERKKGGKTQNNNATEERME